jgi:aspartate/methionine/tyrosine aminotransferase
MFAMTKTYRYAERCCGKMTITSSEVKDQKRQLQRNFDNEVERLNQKLARLALQKEQADEKLQV